MLTYENNVLWILDILLIHSCFAWSPQFPFLKFKLVFAFFNDIDSKNSLQNNFVTVAVACCAETTETYFMKY